MMFMVYIGVASVLLSLAMLFALSRFAGGAGSGRSGSRLWLLPLLLLVLAAGAYWVLNTNSAPGNDKASVEAAPAAAPNAEHKAQGNTAGDLNVAVNKLAEKMANDPKNGEGWLLLARTYGQLQRFGEAADAYAKAAALLPPDASLFADWVDVYVMAHDRKWDNESRQILKRALAADGKHLKSLALAGNEAYDRGDYKAAVDFWKQMKAIAPEGSAESKLADDNLQEAAAAMGGAKPVVSVASSPVIAGTVTVSAKLQAKVAPGDTVFVVAKSPDGKGPPLAVQRLKASGFPLAFKLDDSLAMMPGRNISSVSEVLLSVKLSKEGVADERPGDLYGLPVKVKVGSEKQQLELSEQR
jgi:cytochrome c-type biogenesis protein CcmH